MLPVTQDLFSRGFLNFQVEKPLEFLFIHNLWFH